MNLNFYVYEVYFKNTLDNWLYTCCCIYKFLFFIALLTYPLVGTFYFIKTGKFEDITSIPDSFPTYIDKKYRELLKYL